MLILIYLLCSIFTLAYSSSPLGALPPVVLGANPDPDEVSIADIEANLPEYDRNAELTLSREEEVALEYVGGLLGLAAGDITSILSLSKIGIGLVSALDKIFTHVFSGTTIDFSFLDRPNGDKELLAMFQLITHRLDQIQTGIEGTEASLQDMIRGLPNMLRWEIAINTLEEYMRPINSLHHRFSFYQKHKDEVESHTLKDFADNVVSHDSRSVQSLMANIHTMVAPTDPPIIRGSYAEPQSDYNAYRSVSSRLYRRERYMRTHRLIDGNRGMKPLKSQQLDELYMRPSVFIMLKQSLENVEPCQLSNTPQQLVFGLYTLIALTQARAFAMINFSWTLLKFHEKGNFTLERRLASELYTHYSRNMLVQALQVVEDVPNHLRKCDPDKGKHVEGETYEQITELLQGYIENEVDMNPSGTCGHQCSSYEHSPIFGCFLPDNQFCGKHRRCRGQVHNCKYFHADAWVCLSEDRERRYDWIKYENSKVLGKSGDCKNVMKVDSWWRFLYHCSYCNCLCDDPNSPTTDRSFSLMPVVSDVVNGMVVTGIRFRKVGRIIHMQVQQAKTMAQGQLKPQSREWVDVEAMKIGGDSKHTEGKHYTTMVYQSRSFDLDRLIAPKGHVVTGVKFRTLGSHINLEMWVTPINFTTGELSPQLSYWKSNDNTPIRPDNPRTELRLNDPDDPRKAVIPALSTNPTDSFLKFSASSREKDASQLTVPFLDAQDVTTVTPTWLQGLEIHHRAPRGYGGFIGFRIFNYNITRHFEGVLEYEDL